MTIHILAIVPFLYDTAPGQRFRLEQWDPLLRRDGIEIDYAPFEDDRLRTRLHKPGGAAQKVQLLLRAWGRRAKLLRSVNEYDAVYVFREAALLGSSIFERRVWRSGVPMIFDFDDAVFVPYKSPSNGYLSLLKFPSKTAAICRMSAHVMAGNAYLADYACRHNPRVTVVPTTIDTEKYTVEPRPPADVPTVGWSGSYSTVQYLDTLREPLRRLAERVRFRLRVIGTHHYEVEGLDVEAMPWRSETEVANLRPIDVGVMPLPDDPWSKGKCGLKALQYMGLGIPTVCSPVGVNSEIIRDGENGFLASTPDEWVGKLERLVRSEAERRRLGAAGRGRGGEILSRGPGPARAGSHFRGRRPRGSGQRPRARGGQRQRPGRLVRRAQGLYRWVFSGITTRATTR